MVKDQNIIFGKNLKRLLNDRNRTQAELSEYLGVTTGAVSNWVNGKKAPRIDKIDKIAEFLNCSREELLVENIEPPEKTASFSRKLEFYLDQSGKSQSDLAREIGVTSSAVNQWLKKGNMPSMSTISQIANVLGVTVNELIGDELNTEVKNVDAELYDKRRLLFDKSKRASSEDLDKILDIVDIILGNKDD